MIKNDGFHQYKVRKIMRPPTTNKNSPEARTALVRVAQTNVFNCIIVSPVLMSNANAMTLLSVAARSLGKAVVLWFSPDGAELTILTRAHLAKRER